MMKIMIVEITPPPSFQEISPARHPRAGPSIRWCPPLSCYPANVSNTFSTRWAATSPPQPVEKCVLAVSFPAARHALVFLFLPTLALLALLALLSKIVVGLLIVPFTGPLSCLSAFFIFWHRFTPYALLSNWDHGQEPGPPVQVHPDFVCPVDAVHCKTAPIPEAEETAGTVLQSSFD
jgi:hypothetical protein